MNTTEIKVTKMNYTKAKYVEQAYDAAWDDNIHSEGCYALAIAAAHELGGIEVENSNAGDSSKSLVPAKTFEFDDASSAYVSYGGVYVIATNQTDHHHTDKQ